MNTGKFMIAGMCLALLSGGHLAAQEADFDLASQRSEVQDVLPVPGKKLDHGGIIVNPVPHDMSVDRASRLDVSKGVAVNDRQKKFAGDVDFLALDKKGVKLNLDFGAKAARKAGVKELSGAYQLRVNGKGITITGYDERGTFYGLQTLRQLLASPEADGGRLPYVTVNDWPDLPNRGVVEGFYGSPWSHDVRMSLIDFYGRTKMNVYLYGPKDDPYHSCPNWRLPYPEKEAKNIKELIDACRRNRVDFVWAIHPGQDIKWNEEDYNNLVNKFNLMYDLGVRDFAIFFDDISGEGTNPERQTELLNRLTDEFVKAKGDVSSLTVCPTDYSGLWAKPGPDGPLAIYGKTMNPEIKVFWTGDVVCSDLTPSTLEFVNSRIRRPAYYWWNYPVTDYVRNILLQGPVYGLDTSLTADDVCGVVSNPMEHGEASKLALYGVADYTWNVAGYNPIDNWERGLAELAPAVKDAYRTFAIHSSDTETGYRRDESWETTTFRLADWTDDAAAALEAEFRKIEAVPAQMEAGCDNALLLSELRPWLVEFGKVGTRGRRAIEIARAYRDGNDDARFWDMYVGNLMNADDRKAYEDHKSGTMKLHPFYERAMNDMAYGFMQRQGVEAPCDYTGIGSYGNSGTMLTKLMLDNDTTTYYTSAASQKLGDWIGLDLRAPRDLSVVSIRQGRNSVDDVDYFDHAILECSADGKTWTPLIADMTNQYDIDWQGEPVKARYVRLRRLDSKRSNWASVRTFVVNPVTADNLGFAVEAPDMQQAFRAFDSSLLTSFANNGTLLVDIKDGLKGYTLLTGKLAHPLTVKQIAKDGSVVSEQSVATPYTRIDLVPGAARLSIDGQAEIFEIIPRDK